MAMATFTRKDCQTGVAAACAVRHTEDGSPFQAGNEGSCMATILCFCFLGRARLSPRQQPVQGATEGSGGMSCQSRGRSAADSGHWLLMSRSHCRDRFYELMHQRSEVFVMHALHLHADATTMLKPCTMRDLDSSCPVPVPQASDAQLRERRSTGASGIAASQPTFALEQLRSCNRLALILSEPSGST